MRTGSTFVSEFFNRHPSVFFIYEPLQRKSSFYTVLVNGTALVRDFLQCHFKDKAHNQTAFWFFNRFCKLRTLKMCEDFQKVVNDPNFTPYMERLCQEKSTRVVKEIQFRKLQYVTPLVSEGLRVVLLYRDPRGVLDGRRRSLPGRYNYTDGLEHQDISWYCYSMMRDWRYLVTLPWSVRQRYYIIRYEDIAINPVQGAVAMYNFLGITMDETVLSWARGVAKGNSTSTDGLYSTTRRNARHSAQIWRQQLDFSLVMQVQEACQDSMLHAGYPMVHTKQQLHDLDHFLLEAKDLNSQSEAKTALWWKVASLIHNANMGAHLGPTGPRWAPSWPHELCWDIWRQVNTWANAGLLSVKWPGQY